MNWRRRSDLGWPNSASGVPSSSISPLCMNRVRSETSRANFISCVTNSILRPSSASWRMTRNTSPTISGSSAEVRSEEHTSELQSLMRISYAVFCLKKKKKKNIENHDNTTQHTTTHTQTH